MQPVENPVTGLHTVAKRTLFGVTDGGHTDVLSDVIVWGLYVPVWTWVSSTAAT